jgi:hypothetical protein
MNTVNKYLTALIFGLAVTTLASPSFAQRSEDHMSAGRAAAIRECSGEMQKIHREKTVAQNSMYRSCMMEHGEPE